MVETTLLQRKKKHQLKNTLFAILTNHFVCLNLVAAMQRLVSLDHYCITQQLWNNASTSLKNSMPNWENDQLSQFFIL